MTASKIRHYSKESGKRAIFPNYFVNLPYARMSRDRLIAMRETKKDKVILTSRFATAFSIAAVLMFSISVSNTAA